MSHHEPIGPQDGSLLIVGGSTTLPLFQRFLRLSGGPAAPVVVIPTADGQHTHPPARQGTILRPFSEAGATNVTMLHTKDRVEADSDAFAQLIREAQGVWFPGGRHTYLVDAYRGTKTEEALHDLLDRGGCIGGSSAGATVQGSYMVRGDTRGNMILEGDHEDGFGFLKNVVIDQHLLKRNRQHDLVDVIRKKPELLGIGIDEDTAIEVHGDSFTVVGDSYVAIYDIEQMGDRGAFYFLAPGDRFDLQTRTAERVRRQPEPLWLPHLMDAIAVSSDHMIRYAGTYGNEASRARVTVDGEKLLLEVDEREPIDLVPVDLNLFSGEGWGERVEFEMEDERAASVIVRDLHGITTRYRRRAE